MKSSAGIVRYCHGAGSLVAIAADEKKTAINRLFTPKMRDFTTNDYCDYLWINDLLSLKKGPNNEFTATIRKSGEEKTVKISNVIVSGTVVEMKEIGERGILYSIDDGTGIITCKYNDQAFAEIFDIIHEEEGQILNDSFNMTGNQSEINYTMSEDDTIFNDQTLQEEELAAMKHNMLKGLHSIWVDIEDSFSNMIAGLKIGDIVVIYGRLYNYFEVNQIHVNIIRCIDLKEEIFLTHIKLVDGYEPVGGTHNVSHDSSSHVHLVENNRRSGIMTFDHIQHLDVTEIPTSKFLSFKENVDERQARNKKRKSVIMPHLHGSMTFDTFNNLNDSGPGPKSKLIKR